MKDWPYPKITAHRGGGSLAPENTIAAIRLGQSLGYRWHEFDVKLSRDGVAFLLHDATLERTTNAQGRACDWDWERLRELDAGAWHSERFRGERLASFEEAAHLLRSEGTMANIEIKASPGFERETGAKVARMAAELWRGADVQPLLSSFSFEALMAAKEAQPGLLRAWVAKEIQPEDWRRLSALDAAAMHTDYRTLQHGNVERLHAAGVRIQLYTVNDPVAAQGYFDWGVDGIITDNLETFAQRFPKLI